MENGFGIGGGAADNSNLLPDQRCHCKVPTIRRWRSGDFDSKFEGDSVVDNVSSGDNKCKGS